MGVQAGDYVSVSVLPTKGKVAPGVYLATGYIPTDATYLDKAEGNLVNRIEITIDSVVGANGDELFVYVQPPSTNKNGKQDYVMWTQTTCLPSCSDNGECVDFDGLTLTDSYDFDGAPARASS